MLNHSSNQKYSRDIVPLTIAPRSSCATSHSNTPSATRRSSSSEMMEHSQRLEIVRSYLSDSTVIRSLAIDRAIFRRRQPEPPVRSSEHDERRNPIPSL